jgi:Flp pilus assembly protein TadD
LDSYVLLGTFFEQSGRPERAVEVLQGARSRAPSNIALLRHLGGALDKLNRFEPAREAYEAVLKQNPKDTAIANNLAILIADAWPQDAALLNEAARLSQDFRLTTDPVFLDTQGWVQYRLGNYQDAIALIQSAAERMPDEGQVHYHLGMAYQAQGDQERAQAELRLAVSGSGSYRGREEAQKALGIN